MKSQYNKPLFILMGFILLAATCAKESEEKYDEDQNYPAVVDKDSTDEMKGSTGADWQRYYESSQRLLAIAEANLQTLQVRLGDKGKRDSALEEFYNRSSQKLVDLKKQLADEQKELDSGTDRPTVSEINDNHEFRKRFRAELLELNTALDQAVESEAATQPTD